MSTLIAFDQRQLAAVLRDWTAQQLLDELRSGRCGATLSRAEATELSSLVQAWVQRALGPMPLRDVLLVDHQRGSRVYGLLCAMLTAGRYPLPPALAQAIEPLGSSELSPAQLRSVVGANATPGDTTLSELLARAEREGLGLLRYDGPTARYDYPPYLETLLPTPPRPLPRPLPPFEQPSGWRRNVAMLAALTGVALLALPLLNGSLPHQPAGLPLALLTLALLIGIRAGVAGFVGSLCIWLVANLPDFHHGTIIALWPTLPLLIAGVILLALDRNVRAMWRWIRHQGRE